jgi:hypothetical protein
MTPVSVTRPSAIGVDARRAAPTATSAAAIAHPGMTAPPNPSNRPAANAMTAVAMSGSEAP